MTRKLWGRGPWSLAVVGLPLCICLGLGFAAAPRAAAAIPAADGAAPAGAVTESLSAWRYYEEIPLPAQDSATSPWWDFVLGPSVFDAAQPDLADLRLYDVQGREVPFAMRIRAPHPATAEVPATTFNEVDGGSQISLDLGERPVEHNAVEVYSDGTDVRRAVLLEGSDDGQKWSKLAEKNLLNFQSVQEKFIDRSIKYNPSRYRYLRISLRPDPQVDRRTAKIDRVVVQRPTLLPGEFVTYPATPSARELIRTKAGPASAWTIDLGGNHVPCSRLTARVADGEFVRDYRVEMGAPPEARQPFYQIAQGEWHRRAGEVKGDLVAEFGETQAARLRLVVIDHRNQPLLVEGVSVSAPARCVIVARAAELRGPLRLYFGNPKAEGPNYDFARNLDPRLEPTLEPAPVRLTAGVRTENPAFLPEPLPLTERLPWLIYVLLGATVGVLGLLIVSLARTAIALEDNRRTPRWGLDKAAGQN